MVVSCLGILFGESGISADLATGFGSTAATFPPYCIDSAETPSDGLAHGLSENVLTTMGGFGVASLLLYKNN